MAAANKSEDAPEASTEAPTAANAPTETAPAKRHRRTEAEMDAARAAEAAAQSTSAEPVQAPGPSPEPEAGSPTGTDTPKPDFFAAAAAAKPAETGSGDSVTDVLRKQFQADPSFQCPVQVLFIDCVPAKGWPGDAPAPLTEFMHAFERAAASSSQALDWRLIDYGKGKGWLATAIKVLMKALPAAIYIDSRTPGADVFESVVTPYVKAIFRGSRG